MDNDFTPFGCQRIGQALTFNKTITKLTINHNDIGDAGAVKLMQGEWHSKDSGVLGCLC